MGSEGQGRDDGFFPPISVIKKLAAVHAVRPWASACLTYFRFFVPVHLSVDPVCFLILLSAGLLFVLGQALHAPADTAADLLIVRCPANLAAEDAVVKHIK